MRCYLKNPACHKAQHMAPAATNQLPIKALKNPTVASSPPSDDLEVYYGLMPLIVSPELLPLSNYKLQAHTTCNYNRPTHTQAIFLCPRTPNHTILPHVSGRHLKLLTSSSILNPWLHRHSALNPDTVTPVPSLQYPTAPVCITANKHPDSVLCVVKNLST